MYGEKEKEPTSVKLTWCPLLALSIAGVSEIPSSTTVLLAVFTDWQPPTVSTYRYTSYVHTSLSAVLVGRSHPRWLASVCPHSILQESQFPFVCSWVGTTSRPPCGTSTRNSLFVTMSTWFWWTRRRGGISSNRWPLLSLFFLSSFFLLSGFSSVTLLLHLS